MRILFLDDDASRHQAFARNSIGHIVHAAWGYEECCYQLQGPDVFDQAHLDHDLSDMAAAGMPAKDEKTGTHVAEFIAAMPPEKRPRLVVLHSFNDAGWRRMARILDEAGVDWIRRQFSPNDVPPTTRGTWSMRK